MRLSGFRKRSVVYFFLLLVLTVSFLVYAVSYVYQTSNDFDVVISQGDSLIFQLAQHDVLTSYPYIAIFADSSDFNASGCDLVYSGDYGGSFEFTMDNDCDLTFGFNYGEMNSPSLVNGGGRLYNGETVSCGSGVTYRLVFDSFDLAIFNTNINVGVNAVIILVFLLAPIVGLFMLGLGKWSIVVGLTVGGVLGYFALPLMITNFVFPEWVLVSVFMIDIAVFWASWRSGG